MVVEPPDLAQALLADLRTRLGAPGIAWAEPPQTIAGGAENLTAGLRLSGAPPALSGPLVLRRYKPERDPAGVHFERAVHEALAAQGYPAPRVWLACDDPKPIGGAYLLMERLPGRVLLGELVAIDRVTPGSLLRALPRMTGQALFRVPRDLGRMHARLHALDARAVEDAVERAGFPAEAFSAAARLEVVARDAADAGLDDMRPAIDWLRARVRAPRERVVCHGDFHFLNMLVEGPRVTGLLDWSRQHLCFDEPELDVGNTRALFDLSVPGIPRALRPPFEAVQRRLRRRYTARYEAESGRRLDPERLLWAEVYRYTRELVGVGRALRAGARTDGAFIDDFQNPWLIPGVHAGALAGIERRTGVRARLPGRESAA